MAVSDDIQTPNNYLPTVSVVIPTFNRAHLLPRAIKSILAQTFSDFELIIVDDGSTDNTAEVVAGFADPRIRFIPLGKNCGGSHARNQGIKAARAEYVAFLDSDDEWLPEKLELQMECLRSSNDSNATVVYCHGYEYYESIKRQKLSNLVIHEGNVFNHLLKGWSPPTTSLMMVKRSVLINVGGFDEKLPSFQDIDLFLSLAKANNHFIAAKQPLIKRYFHDEQIGGRLSANYNGFQIFIDKWGKTIQQNLGSKGYSEFVGLKTSFIKFIPLRQAMDNGHRLAALSHSITLLKYLPWSKYYVVMGLLFTLFGQNGYASILKIKSAISKSKIKNDAIV